MRLPDSQMDSQEAESFDVEVAQSEAEVEYEAGPDEQLEAETSMSMHTAQEFTSSRPNSRGSVISHIPSEDVFITDFTSPSREYTSELPQIVEKPLKEFDILGSSTPKARASSVRHRNSTPIRLRRKPSSELGDSVMNTSYGETFNREPPTPRYLFPPSTPTISTEPSMRDSTTPAGESMNTTVSSGGVFQRTSDSGRDKLRNIPMPIREDLSLSHLKSSQMEMGESTTIAMDTQIRRISDERTIEELESHVEYGLQVLDQLSAELKHHLNSQDDAHAAKDFLRRVRNVRSRARIAQTLIGVMGGTGAGKSSVINALLEEERIVPTNNMRACTAVVTEISYNFDTLHKYRAVVEFINREDWAKELNLLFKEVRGAGGNEFKSDDDGEVAKAKFKAVYPLITSDQLSRLTVNDLLDQEGVASILGQERILEHDDVNKFYNELQVYADSVDKDDDKDKREMGYWPLIKVVKIYVKAEVLKTGAVLVDLPGVQDSNAARAAVAERYKQRCDALWILAAIIRAVDDKTARNLMGDGFKRQAQMDGISDRMTFICSNTDDLSATESDDAWKHDAELKKNKQLLARINKRFEELTEENRKCRCVVAHLESEAENLDEEEDEWEELAFKIKAGGAAFAPNRSATGKRNFDKKRKRANFNRRSSKRICQDSVSDDDVSDMEIPDSQSDVGKDASQQVLEETSPNRTPLTIDDIEAKISKADIERGR